jgi:hypothetical protein
MKAIVNVNHRDMRGNAYRVHEMTGNIVTLEYVIEGKKILVDFVMREVQILLNGVHVSVFRNQADRDGHFIDYSPEHGYVIEYSMPNGRTFKNVLKNPFITNDYKSLSDRDYTKKFLNR